MSYVTDLLVKRHKMKWEKTTRQAFVFAQNFFSITDEIMAKIVYLVIGKLFNLTNKRSRVFQTLGSHRYSEENLTWMKPIVLWLELLLLLKSYNFVSI